jgi:anti-sigma regulatory factor (Ser/Thr protein kinase)
MQDTQQRELPPPRTEHYRFMSRELTEQLFELPLIAELYAAKFISEAEYSRLTVAFQEALANSLEHGNLELPSGWKEEIDPKTGIDRFSRERAARMLDPKFGNRTLEVDLHFDGKVLTIRIRDSGPGFEPPATRIMEARDVSLDSFGRGLQLLYATMDEVTYAARGTEITLVKRLPTHDQEK